MNIPGHLTSEENPRVAVLRTRMDAFYQTTQDYSAFQHANHLPEQWGYVRQAILSVLKERSSCRVLEIGAGRSGFAEFVQDIRSSLHYTAQDVTRSNQAHLQEAADAVHFGSVAELDGEYDVIFSSFVLEHISDPRSTLEKLFTSLPTGGKLFIFCPRYDVPFYLSHSADHYGMARRLGVGLSLTAARLWALVTRQPLFFIHTDPAIFHIPWDRDRDAIHWASLWDLRLFFGRRGRTERLKLRSGNLKDWIVKNVLQINISVTRVS